MGSATQSKAPPKSEQHIKRAGVTLVQNAQYQSSKRIEDEKKKKNNKVPKRAKTQIDPSGTGHLHAEKKRK